MRGNQLQKITGVSLQKTQSAENLDSEGSEYSQQELSLCSQKSEQPCEGEESEEEQLEWIATSKPQDVYFVLYTNRSYSNNEQLYNFYGRRSNRFLLLGYNFAILANKYDSYCFRMVVQPLSCVKPVAAKLVFSKIINTKESSGLIITRQLRLKKQRVCIGKIVLTQNLSTIVDALSRRILIKID